MSLCLAKPARTARKPNDGGHKKLLHHPLARPAHPPPPPQTSYHSPRRLVLRLRICHLPPLHTPGAATAQEDGPHIEVDEDAQATDVRPGCERRSADNQTNERDEAPAARVQGDPQSMAYGCLEPTDDVKFETGCMRDEAAQRGVPGCAGQTLDVRYPDQLGRPADDQQAHHVSVRCRISQRSLFHVLHYFSLRCGMCGYVQGGPIATTLLCYFEPERIYASLVRLHDAYSLHTVSWPGFPGLLEAIYAQKRITELMMPDVFAAFRKHMISTTSHATK
ncbi:hypothetical protein Hypma_002266 [Hypsizygus marmoreus]|uniref:Rab-GAP TBC domain-containing protein n=1 Tax=Hypsizygus marmoreus TaxID=39966 RepID=A0A369K5G3_HYPMA|nr:hypothetical protein Hypma_002266 [Hypsizygus marmoreus]